MTFSNPWAFLLFLLIPALFLIAWPRRNPLYRAREMASLLVRSLIISLIVLALAGISQTRLSHKLATVFLLDASDSMGQAGREAGLNYIRAALAGMTPQDEAGLILFGAEALVERSVSPHSTLNDPTSAPIPSYTNIAGAVRLGLTLFPEDAARRMVILSDGGANLGDARQAVQLAQANGVEVSVVPLPRQPGAEVRLDSLDLPATLHEAEEFDLTVKLHSTAAGEVPLQIFNEGRLVAQQTLALQAGDNTFVLPLTAGAQGFTSFQARIAPPRDTFAQNNTLDAFSQVQGPPTILVLADQFDEGQPLAEALRGAGLTVTQYDPAKLPSDLAGLSEFKAIVLVNVPATRFSPRQMTTLQAYVRDLGGGLVVVGGEGSYGPGGYFQTPLEETLPVEMTIQDEERLPGMTLLLVIDKSGSMETSGTQQWGWGIPRKVELAKEAIYRSVDLLVPWDRVGVVAFDNAARWVVVPVAAADVKAIKNAVGTIRASGGTDILAGLQLAAQAMTQETTQVRHIVLLTDGGADPSSIPDLARSLAGQGVTLSVVAIGENYAPFLEDVARLGNGRFHFAADPGTIPQIFAQETSLATRSYIVEEDFTPQVAGSSPILQGLTELPALRGYVATSPKLTAWVILRGGAEQDPLLAQWQYGLGRAVAWTSDAKGQWAVNWLDWPAFPRFWSQAVRWTIVEGTGGALETQVRLEGDRAVVTAEVVGPDGRYRNDLDVTLNLIDPDFEQQPLVLQQTAPGLYEGSFRPDKTGTYLLHVAGLAGDELVASQTRGFVMSYSPEYQTTEIDPALLPDLASIGGGRVLPADAPAEVFAHTLPPAQGTTPLWPWFLAAAILLLPVDVGLRRVIFGREDVRRLWTRLAANLPQQSETAPLPEVSSAGRLLKVKARPPVETEPVPPPPVKSTLPPEPSPEPASSPKGKPAQEADNTVRRLLRAKRRRE